jgi:serine/threonine protein kinase
MSALFDHQLPFWPLFPSCYLMNYFNLFSFQIIFLTSLYFFFIGAQRQWFKAVEGLGDVCQTGRDVSFCGHTILPPIPQIMVIEDALEDVRFAGNPLVLGGPGIRFYAGAPLVSSANGYRYGSLCIIDTKPHKEFTPEQYNLLAQFGELTVREIEKDKLNLLQKMVQEQRGTLGLSASASPAGSLRSSVSELEPANWGLSRAANCFVEGVMLVDVATTTWQILYTNPAFSTVLGVPKDEATSQGFWDMFGGAGIDADTCAASVEANEPFSITVALQSIYRQTPKSVTIDFRPTATTQLGLVGVPVGPELGAVQPSSGSTPALSDLPNNVNAIDASEGQPSPARHLFFAILQPDQLRPGAVRPVSDRRIGIIQEGEPVASQQPLQISSSGSGNTSAGTALSINKAMPTAFTDVRLGPLIGRGAYGRVYRGSWNGNTVAVKVMETTENLPNPGESLPSNEVNGGARGLFEAVLSSSLSHPNVVHTYQYAVRHISKPMPGTKVLGEGARRGSLDTSATAKHVSEVWLISEFCNRGPLLTAIERGAFLTQPSAQYGQPNLIAVLQTLQEVAAAMHYLHSQGIVHGDLTGGNVLLTSSDKDARGFSAKVVDFGLSRVCGESGYLQTNTMGCAEYMPPELITGGILTKAGDVYAFGIIVWEMYVGRRAWEGLQPGQVLKKVASNEMLVFPGQTPHRLKILGERCISSDPKLRPTFVEVLSEVNAILTDTMSILQQFLHATAANGTGTVPTKH